MMSSMLSLFPSTSQLNLALLDFDLLPTNLPLFTVPSTSQDIRPTSPKDVKCVVGPMTIQAPPVQLIRTSQRRCSVCQAGSAAPHYGGIVCGGCKIFFARVIQRRIYFVCDKNNMCKMSPGKRSKCRSCRFQLCLKAKMCPEEVGKLREMKMPDSLLIPKEEGAVVSYFDNSVLQNTMSDKRIRLEKQFLGEFSSANQIRSVIRTFINVERSCDNSSCPFSSENTSCTLAVSLADAFRNPRAICERTPIHWEKSRLNSLITDPTRLVQSYCRLTVHYLEFLQSVEDIYQLKEKHRLNLISSRMCPCVLLTLAYNCYKYESDSLLLDVYSQSPKLIKRFLESVKSQVIQRMKELDMNDEEYVLIKLITIFMFADPLSCDDAEATVRTIRFKHERFLASYIRDAYPDWNTEKIYVRVKNMLEFVSILSKLSHVPLLVIVLAVSLNVGQLRGHLTYDLHIRRYD